MKKVLLTALAAVLLVSAAGCSRVAEQTISDTAAADPITTEEQVSAEQAPGSAVEAGEYTDLEAAPSSAALQVSDLAAVLDTLDLTEAILINHTETDATYPAKAAICAKSYIEELKSFVWKEYALPPEWDQTDEFFCRLIAGDVTVTAYQYGYCGDRPLHLVTEEGEGWFILPYIQSGPNKAPVQVSWMIYDTFFSWCLEAEAAALYGMGGIPLTAEELDHFQEFTSSEQREYDEEWGGYVGRATEISCFFTSLYNDPRDMDAVEFLYYCPDQGILELEDEAEWQLVQRKKDWRFGEDNHLATIGELPVPVHRLPRTYINEILTKYAGITVEEMHTDWLTEALYIPETDCFYTFSSDFGPGTFYPCYGEKNGDIVTLWEAPVGYDGSTKVLTLQKSGENWHILSHNTISN